MKSKIFLFSLKRHTRRKDEEFVVRLKFECQLSSY